MKKFLSLVLALVMTMSLVTISAGAKDFTDDKSITYGEAVDVVSAIGVVDGYTDGSFNPSATLTRGAAAKIICNLLLGPTTASALVADAAPFSDVPTSNVFAGYIAYCAKQGIISGYADGTFRPTGTLTSYAFMKMLLGALGYDAQVEGFVGGNWSVQVAKTALGIGLDEGLIEDFNGIKPVTREEAALYAFNTLTANMVTYGSTVNMNVNGANVNIGGSREWDKDVTTTDGNIDGVWNPVTGKWGDGIVQFAERYFTKLYLNTGYDAFMRPANVWQYKSDSIGTYAKTADAKYTKSTVEADIYKDCGLTAASDSFVVYVDGLPASDYDSTMANTVTIRKNEQDNKIGTGNGSTVEVFKDDGIIAIVNTYVGEVITVEEATAKREAYIELGPVGTQAKTPNADMTILDNAYKFNTDKFEVGDIVSFNYSMKDSDLTPDAGDPVVKAASVKNVQATESVTGKVESFTTNKKFVMDGITYEYGAKKANIFGAANIGAETTIYLDSNGYALYAKETKENIKNYALVLAAGTESAIGSSSYKAELLYTDGTAKVVTTDKQYGDDVGPALPSGEPDLVGEWVTYKTNSKGEIILTQLTQAAKASGAGTTVETKNGDTTIKLSGSPSTVKINSATIIIVKDSNNKFKVYEGVKNIPTITATGVAGVPGAADAFAVYGTGTFKKLVYIDAASSGIRIDNGNSKNIFLVADTKSTVVETASDKYYIFDAVVDGKLIEGGVMLDANDGYVAGGPQTKTAAVIEDLVINGNNVLLKSYAVDSNGIYTVMPGDSVPVAQKLTAGAVEKVSGTCLAFDTDNNGTLETTYYTADDCVFYRVDSYGNLSKTTISSFRTDTIGGAAGDYYSYIGYTLNSDAEITGVYWQYK